MITLPPPFAATKYPGYFWNTEDKKLYSLKVNGILKPLRRRKNDRWCNLHWSAGHWFYYVSVDGQRRYLTQKYLESLEISYHIIPMENKKGY